jgi:replication factor C subunit 3/5
MSDIEDGMDIDASAKDVIFAAEAKGKRSAANLPVEAEDSLPWVEKYRPVTLDDVSGHKDIVATINKFVEVNRLPHLLLYGPPGTGKTSTILALARRIYRSAAKPVCRSFEESRSLGMLRKAGGMLLLRLNTGQRPGSSAMT